MKCAKNVLTNATTKKKVILVRLEVVDILFYSALLDTLGEEISS